MANVLQARLFKGVDPGFSEGGANLKWGGGGGGGEGVSLLLGQIFCMQMKKNEPGWGTQNFTH